MQVLVQFIKVLFDMQRMVYVESCGLCKKARQGGEAEEWADQGVLIAEAATSQTYIEGRHISIYMNAGTQMNKPQKNRTLLSQAKEMSR
jgi:hypothetical protein